MIIIREIADYIDSIGKKTGFARIVGNSGGIIAGSLTIAGGVMTVMTAGAAAPVLVAGAGIGLASGMYIYIYIYSILSSEYLILKLEVIVPKKQRVHRV